MLEIEIGKRLRDYEMKVKIHVARTEILMMAESNGCGTATLFRWMAGQQNHHAGRIPLDLAKKASPNK